MTLRVRYIGPMATYSGFGRAAADNCMALIKSGVDLDVCDLPDGKQDTFMRRYAPILDFYQKKPFDWPTHVILHTPPRPAWKYVDQGIFPPGVKKICHTAWETDLLPREDAEKLSRYFDCIIVPSTFCKTIFTISGVPPNQIEVVPYAFDPSWWKIVDRPSPQPFVFLSAGVWNQRKNLTGLLIAYWTEFQAQEDVLLRIVCGLSPQMMASFELLKEALALPTYAPVEFVHGDTEWCPEEEYRQAFYKSHCYVTLTRGEGFGLGAFEAMLLGLPVIATEWSGQLDFLNSYKNYWPIEYTLTPCIRVKVGIDGTQCWAEPDLMMARGHMRDMYEGASKVSDISNERLSWERKYGYEAIGHQLKTILERLS